jgi:hypothetical protein
MPRGRGGRGQSQSSRGGIRSRGLSDAVAVSSERQEVRSQTQQTQDVIDETEKIKGMKWCGKTTYNYAKSLSEFLGWLNVKHPTMCDGDGLSSLFVLTTLSEFCNQKKKWDKK